MTNFFFAGPAPWFTVPAIVGTIFFGVRLVLLLVGADHLFGGDVDSGVGGHGPVDHHADSTETFKVLTIQGVAAFLMGFGWAGFGGLRGSSWGIPECIGVGIVGGVLMVWLLGWLMKGVYDLQSHGNIDITTLVGLEGDVYVMIPSREAGSGTGRISVVVGNRQRFYPARSDGPEMARGARVRIMEVTGDRILVVHKL